MSAESSASRPWLRTLTLAIGLVLVAGGGTYLWVVQRPVPADFPDTIDQVALETALTPDTSLPLDIEHTDVLLIAACTLRRDRMGVYGHDQPTTPFFDRLAEQGVVFEEHFSQTPWTRPAMGALFTGKWPRQLKLDNPGAGKGFSAVLHTDHTLISEVMAAHGYTTIGAVANPNLKTRFGFAQGFSAYFEPEGTYKERTPIPSADEVVDNLLAMAAAVPPDQRLYARINVLDTHLPQKYHPRYLKLFDTQPKRLAKYDAALRTVDAELARLFTELRATRPNLLVLFAADHGEGLFLPRHHGPEHGNHVYRSTTQTPWIVYHPALPEPGRRIEGRSMNVDVLPTLADLLGVPSPDGVNGVSQKGALVAHTTKAAHMYAYSETFFRRRHLSMVYDGEHQLIRTYTRPTETGPYSDQLFAAADWQANDDILLTRPTDAARLDDVLTEWEQTSLTLAAEAPAVVNDDVDASTDQMLKDLGYVD